ncbi:MAG: AmmeMemoRadiSam system protein B [Planctomycetota bacterium]
MKKKEPLDALRSRAIMIPSDPVSGKGAKTPFALTSPARGSTLDSKGNRMTTTSDWKRSAVVAGAFYPERPDELRALVKSFIEPSAPKTKALGVLVPHAGYIYSGGCAGKTYSRVAIPSSALVFGVNHRALGAPPVSIWDRGSWDTPLGTVAIDELFSRQLVQRLPLVAPDRMAHTAEHSLEVQLPFLQVLKPGIRLIALSVRDISWDIIETVAAGIASLISGLPAAERPLLIASGDMSHQVSADEAKRLDQYALDAMLELDAQAFYESRFRYQIPMCAYASGALMLETAKNLGATKATLVEWTHSGVRTRDNGSVVSYAGVIVEAN